MIYLIADTHFGHANIIKYCNRPYYCVEDMNKDLIHRWNNIVTNSDKVFVLGDFALGTADQIKEWGRQLNGSKILIRGNHDRHTSKTYREAGFKQVIDYPILIEDYFLLSHYPVFTNSNSPFFNIYGHVHNNTDYKTLTDSSCCISVERWQYNPVSLEFLKKLFINEKYRNVINQRWEDEHRRDKK